MKHISEVWDLFESCQTEDELEDAIGEIPSKFGLFYIDRKDSDTVTVTNTYYDEQLQDYFQERVDFDIPEIEKNKE